MLWMCRESFGTYSRLRKVSERFTAIKRSIIAKFQKEKAKEFISPLRDLLCFRTRQYFLSLISLKRKTADLWSQIATVRKYLFSNDLMINVASNEIPINDGVCASWNILDVRRSFFCTVIIVKMERNPMCQFSAFWITFKSAKVSQTMDNNITARLFIFS